MDARPPKALVAAVLVALAGCQPFAAQLIPEITEDPSVSVNVAGTFDWGADELPSPLGTITFTQTGQTVNITQTSHADPTNRDLMGQADLRGNRLDVRLVPSNGDTDYHADVSFLFTTDGNRFRADFADTNGDAGTSWGVRR